MKKTLLIIMACSFFQGCAFQKAPTWTRKLPRAENTTYLYVCEKATEGYVEDARNQAIAKVFQKTAMRLGVPFNSQKVFESVQRGDDLDVIGREYNIPIYMVCEYTEKDGFYYTVYVLCQVAANGNVPAKFDYAFRKCS